MRNLVTLLLSCWAGLAVAAEPAPVPVGTLPAALNVGLERTRLPGGESMGLVGASYVLELAPGWWAGPALYGAASGQRGGLFTWGAEAQFHWHPAPRWLLVGGLYAGGGGGAAAPVGGGLMLRPHAELMFDFGGWSAGIGASQVDFPSGTIRSTQLGLVASFNDRFAFAPPGGEGQVARFDGPAGVGIEHLDVVLGHYAAGNGPAFSTVGIQAEWPLRGPLSATVEAAGAAKGGADGYAEFTAGLLALWPAGGSVLRWGLQGELGMAGGGAVATGGGTLAKLGVVGRLRLAPDWSLDMRAGRARASTGEFRSGYAQIGLGYDFDRAGARGVPGVVGIVHDNEWSLGVEHYLKAARKTGGDPGLSAVSLDLRRSLDDRFYLVGRAVSAISGGAGAYSAGLLGLGVSTPHGAGSKWRAGIEAAAGAAGGGGVSSQGGAVIEPLAWVARAVGSSGQVKLAAGYIKSLRGDLASPVVELSWAIAFGTP